MRATSANTVHFVERKNFQPFGWPRARYHDNRSNFRGAFKEANKKLGVKQMFAPGYHPSSVGRAERYIQLVLKVYRCVLQHHLHLTFYWDIILPGIKNATNTRYFKVLGLSPAVLMLGFEPKYVRDDDEFEALLSSKAMEESLPESFEKEGFEVEEAVFEARLAKLDEIQQESVDRRLDIGKDLATKT